MESMTKEISFEVLIDESEVKYLCSLILRLGWLENWMLRQVNYRPEGSKYLAELTFSREWVSLVVRGENGMTLHPLYQPLALEEHRFIDVLFERAGELEAAKMDLAKDRQQLPCQS